MRIALVVPSGIIKMNAMGNVARPPLGVCCLAAYLKANDYKNVKVFHQVDESQDELIRKILSFQPNIVGFSTMSICFKAGAELAKKIKLVSPKIKTVFGGEHISGIFVDETRYGSSMLTRTLSDCPEIDFTIPFEGEITLLKLVQAIEFSSDYSEIAGIAFLKAGKLVISKNRPRISNLDILPIADRSDLPYGKYCSPDDSPFLEYLHTTRGCKFKCKYCATPVSNPGKITACSAKRILKEIEYLRSKNGRKDFFFCDELFTFNSVRTENFCRGLIDSDLSQKISWRCFARVDDVSKGKIDLSLMKRAGCRGLLLGIESMNQKTLNILGKGITPPEIKMAIEKIFQADIDVWGNLMLGYPWETEKELRKSLSEYVTLAKKGWIKHTYCAFITPFLGTPFYQECVKNNWISNQNFLELNCSEPVLKTPIKKEVLFEIYQEFLAKV